MICNIYSDLKGFKNFTFHKGLNIILADISEKSTNRQTRNRAGKTSLIEIIHFLMGAESPPDSDLRYEDLINNKFGIVFDLGDEKVSIIRSGAEPSKIIIKESSKSDNWVISPRKDKTTQENFVTNTSWKKILGNIFFKLEDEDDDINKYKPTFRSLFSYFVRRERDGGFSSPIKNSSEQQLYDQQLAVTFLLGLEWGIIREWQLIRDREKTLKELRKAIGSGLLGDVIGSVAMLRTKLAIAEDELKKLKEVKKTFKLHPKYHEYENEASDLKRRISKLSNQNIIDIQIIETLESSMKSEAPPSLDELKDLYEEAGLVFPKNIIQRFEDVEAFHKSIIENRKSYLSSEIEEAKERIKHRDMIKIKLSEKKARIMNILESHGALDELTNIQSEISRLEVETETIRQKFTTAKQLEEEKNKLNIERKKLYAQLQRNYYDQKEIIDKAVVLFQDLSSSLYDEAGSFTIEESENGPRFDFQIQGEGSRGIDNMQIFCFDMMIMILCLKRDIGSKFLVHDSHIFDGVDERQISKALQIGAELSEKYGFQYIVTMNSDDLPDKSIGFDSKDFVLPVKLTDSKEDGGLFGLRIKKSKKSSDEELTLYIENEEKVPIASSA